MYARNILVVGSGAREHALVTKLKQSPRAGKIFVAPGNAGTAEDAENVPIAADDIPALLSFAERQHIDLTVVGPEEPLKLRIVDQFRQCGLRIFGPTAKAARLETSKSFGKQFMERWGIATARARTFSSVADALTYVESVPLPCVIKADGLARGKGVMVCTDRDQAVAAVRVLMVRRLFGQAGHRILVEEFLEGEEMSVHVVSDGQRHAYLATAQDHKRLKDGDRGPMTGGMGVIAPVPWATWEQLDLIERQIVGPVLEGLRAEGTPFTGCLFVGLMRTAQGPKVLEFNVRFGDPEAEAILPLFSGDLLDLLESCATGALDLLPGACFKHAFPKDSAASIVIAVPGYPSAPEKALPIALDQSNIPWDGAHFFHGETRLGQNGLETAGGRAMVLTMCQPSLSKAISRAYTLVERVSLKGKQFRRDIGARALNAR